jgi:hypothetical protein
VPGVFVVAPGGFYYHLCFFTDVSIYVSISIFVYLLFVYMFIYVSLSFTTFFHQWYAAHAGACGRRRAAKQPAPVEGRMVQESHDTTVSAAVARCHYWHVLQPRQGLQV